MSSQQRSFSKNGPGDDIARSAQDLRERALTALRAGQFDLAEQVLTSSEVTFTELIENLRIYQAELLIQNEELRRSQAEREEALSRFTAFFMTLPIAELVVDRQGLVMDANNEAERLFSLKPTHLHQHFFARLVEEQDRSKVILAWSRLEREEVVVLTELRFRGLRGISFIGDLHIARLPGELDDRRRFVCAVLDRTEAVQQREDLRAAHESLRESEERYRVLAEFSPDWEYWIDPDGHFIYMSPACFSVTGFTATELTEDPSLLERIIHPDDRRHCMAHFRRRIMNEENAACFNFRLFTRDGRERWIEHVCNPVMSADGRDLGRRGVNRDITERMRAEQELQRSEALLRATGRTAKVGGWELDAATMRLRWTEMTRELYQVDAQFTPTLETSLNFYHPEDRPHLQRAITSALTDGTNFELELRLTTARGQMIWIKAAGDPIRAADGRIIKLCGSFQDISRRVSADQALRERENQYLALFESASEGLCIIKDGRFISVNKAALRMLGYAESNTTALLGRRPSELSPAIQADGEDSVIKEQRLMTQAYDEGTAHFEWSHLNATQHPVVLAISLIRVELRGEPALFATWRDLTRERVAREREQRAQTVFDNTSEGILVTDLGGHIVAVNPAFTTITGYTEAEVLGQTPRLLQSGRHDTAFYQLMWETLLKTGSWRGEFWNRRKNGEIYPQQSTISVVYAADGKPTSYIGVFGDLSQIRHSQEELHRITHHDVLTGLPNRALLQASLEQSLARARRAHSLLALLYLDLDLFKNVNDTLGHPVGDQLLQQVAQVMRDKLREANIIARVGGDEFVILLEDLPEPNAAAKVARRLLTLFSEPFISDSRKLYITASIGISIYPMDGQAMDILLSHADVAMYQAKEHGRNTYCFFEATMTTGAAERLHMENALRGAIARNELFVHYQPQIKLANEVLVGVEALLRWNHPEFGQVSPAMFIPIAEEIGLIRSIGAWVLEQGCIQLAAWDAAGFIVPRIAINLSVQQIESTDLVEQVKSVLQKTKIAPDRLELEVTESMLMRHVEQAIENLYALRDLGITLAIDDFGSGYSSLRYLKQLPIHRLKIDRAFIEHLSEDNNDAAIVRAIIALSQSLGLYVLAEGVETQTQAEFLRAQGCHEVQGYLFGRPMSANDLINQR